MRYIAYVMAPLLALMLALLLVAGLQAQSNSITVEKFAIDSEIVIGEQAKFVIVVSNDGEAIDDLRIHDNLDANHTWFHNQPAVCSINGNALGCEIDLDVESDFEVAVWSSPNTCGVITNQAFAIETDATTYASNKASINVLCPPSVSADKSALIEFVNPGALTGYRITVSNHGGLPSNQVSLFDPLPDDHFWILGAHTFDECHIDAAGASEDALTCRSESIPGGSSVTGSLVPSTVYVEVYVRPRTCGVIQNSATAFHGINPIPTNDAFIVVQCPAPTATPTATATSTPTATVPPPTATPRPPTSTSVPSVSVTPIAPATGSAGLHSDNQRGIAPLLLLGSLAAMVGVAGYIARRRPS